MTVGFVLFLGTPAALVAVWGMSTYRQPQIARRNAAGYRHQHTQNPDYLPGHLGQGGA